MKKILQFLHNWFYSFLSLRCPNCHELLKPAGYPFDYDKTIDSSVKQVYCPKCGNKFIRV